MVLGSRGKAIKEKKEKEVDLVDLIVQKEGKSDAIADIDLWIPKELERTFYYYRRWIWIMFPWACCCSDPKMDFSIAMAKCYSSNTKYMSVSSEKELTQLAIRIAIEAKIKRKKMYTNNIEGAGLNDTNIGIHTDDIKDNDRKSIRDQTFDATNFSSSFLKADFISRGNNESGQKSIKMEENRLDPMKQSKRSSLPSISGATKSQQHSNTETKYFLTREFFHPQNYHHIKENKNNSSFGHSHFQSPSRHSISMIGFLDPKNKTSQRNTVKENQNNSQIVEKSQNRSYVKFSIQTRKSRKGSENASKNIGENLSSMRQSMNQLFKKEIGSLDGKVFKMQTELNKIADQLKTKTSHLKNLKITAHQLSVLPVFEMEADWEAKKRRLEKRIIKIDKRQILTLTDRRRSEQILEICEINRVSNKEWISQLNLLITNQKKMIKWENELIAQLKVENASMARVIEEFYVVHMAKKNTNNELVDQIVRSANAQQELEKIVWDPEPSHNFQEDESGGFARENKYVLIEVNKDSSPPGSPNSQIGNFFSPGIMKKKANTMKKKAIEAAQSPEEEKKKVLRTGCQMDIIFERKKGEHWRKSEEFKRLMANQLKTTNLTSSNQHKRERLDALKEELARRMRVTETYEKAGKKPHLLEGDILQQCLIDANKKRENLNEKITSNSKQLLKLDEIFAQTLGTLNSLCKRLEISQTPRKPAKTKAPDISSKLLEKMANGLRLKMRAIEAKMPQALEKIFQGDFEINQCYLKDVEKDKEKRFFGEEPDSFEEFF